MAYQYFARRRVAALALIGGCAACAPGAAPLYFNQQPAPAQGTATTAPMSVNVTVNVHQAGEPGGGAPEVLVTGGRIGNNGGVEIVERVITAPDPQPPGNGTIPEGILIENVILEDPPLVTDPNQRTDPIFTPPPEPFQRTDPIATPPVDVSAFAGWTSCGSPGRLGQDPATAFSIPTYPGAAPPSGGSGQRVVNGRPVTDPTDFPWMVKLGIFRGETDSLGRPLRGNCGGAVIDESWVLTATHCLAEVTNGVMSGPTSVTVSYGSLTLQQDQMLPRRVEVDKALCASNYRFPENDIAILRLREPVPVRPARLPTPQIDGHLESGGLFEVTATGFGFTENNSFSLDLLQVDIPIDHFENGGTTIVADGPLSTNTICQGDSGGPAHFEDPSAQGFGLNGIERTVVGVSSFTRGGSGATCQFNGTKSGFTRVGPYVERIERAMAACPPAPRPCPALDAI